MGTQAALVFKLLQGDGQRRRDVFGIRARAEVQQQLAHVMRALAHTSVKLLHHALRCRRVSLLQRTTQHLHLDLHEGQALGDRVVQLVGQHGALVGDPRFTLQRAHTQAVHGAGQLAGQGFEQVAVVITQRGGMAKEKIDLADQPLMQPHRHADQGLKTVTRTALRGTHVTAVDGDDLSARLRLSLAAMAGAGEHAQLLVDELLRQAVRREQHVALVRLTAPAHGRCVGMAHAAALLGEAVRQLFQRGGTAYQRGRLIQSRQPLMLGAQVQRLFSDLGFKPLVQPTQGLRHAVKGRSEGAELIIRRHRNARRQVPRLHARQAVLQACQGLEHKEVGGVEHGHTGGYGQGQHRKLEDAQQRGPACELALDGVDKGVDLRYEGGSVTAASAGRQARALQPARTQQRPCLVHLRERRRTARVVRHEQRPRRVTTAQHIEAVLELLDIALDARGVRPAIGIPQLMRQPPGLHAHAPGLVDGRRTAFELPAHRQRQRDRHQRQQQQATTDEPEFCAETRRQFPAFFHQADLLTTRTAAA